MVKHTQTCLSVLDHFVRLALKRLKEGREIVTLRFIHLVRTQNLLKN